VKLFVSSAVIWEIAIKVHSGKLVYPLDEVLGQVGAIGAEPMPITGHHALAAGTLPLHHRDPFDRIMIAQAICEGLTLVTLDRQMDAYGVKRFPI